MNPTDSTRVRVVKLGGRSWYRAGDPQIGAVYYYCVVDARYVVMVRGFFSTYQRNRDAAYYAKGEAALQSVAASLVIVPNGKP
jgi:hypothetical protein